MATSDARVGSRHRALRTTLVLAAGFFWLVATVSFVWGFVNNRFLDSLNREVASRSASPSEQVLNTFRLVSDWHYLDVNRVDASFPRWMARMEHASPLHVSARTALTAGTDLVGPCGAVSRSMVVLLRRAGFQARKAILYERPGKPAHTVVEVLQDGEWRVFDPTFRWYWTRPDGEIATVEDLRDPALLETVLVEHPRYPVDSYRYNLVYRLRWEKVPGLPRVRDLLARWRGEAWVREVQPPRIYERPAFLVGSTSLAWGLVVTGLWVVARVRDGRPREPRPAPA